MKFCKTYKSFTKYEVMNLEGGQIKLLLSNKYYLFNTNVTTTIIIDDSNLIMSMYKWIKSNQVYYKYKNISSVLGHVNNTLKHC